MTDDDQLPSPDDTEQRFAANLRLLRERQDISQVKLAQEMAARGWPWRQQTVTRVENGQRMIRFGEATALAEILHTPPLSVSPGPCPRLTKWRRSARRTPGSVNPSRQS